MVAGWNDLPYFSYFSCAYDVVLFASFDMIRMFADLSFPFGSEYFFYRIELLFQRSKWETLQV
jgi:hypothetical protein